jgi:hypothetical protein
LSVSACQVTARGESHGHVAEAPKKSGYGNDGNTELFRFDCITRVMRGLDLCIRPFRKKMDCWVKPSNDQGEST